MATNIKKYPNLFLLNSTDLEIPPMSSPKSVIIPAGLENGGVSVKAGKTFTGDVWVDMIHLGGSGDVAVANVIFTPCARTHWHTHERGQMLQVIQGSGWICDRGGKARRIKKGDMVWAEAGTTHWHGADEGTLMAHLAIGLGHTEWLEAVSEEDYSKRETQDL